MFLQQNPDPMKGDSDHQVFLQCFQNTSSADTSKPGLDWEGVKSCTCMLTTEVNPFQNDEFWTGPN